MSDFETNKNTAAAVAGAIGGLYLIGGLAVGVIRNEFHRPDSIRAAVAADGFPEYSAGSSFGGTNDTAKFGDCRITIVGLKVEPSRDIPKKDDTPKRDLSPASLVALHEVGGTSDYDVVVPNRSVPTTVRVQSAGELRGYAAANAIPEWRLCFPATGVSDPTQ